MFHHTLAAMNTRFSMVLPALAPEQGASWARDVERLLREQEWMMSRFIGQGDLGTLNRCAAEAPVQVSEGLWEVLQACRRHHQLTQGAFDIALGGRVPGSARQAGMHTLQFDDAARTVRFTAPGTQLDLGAIGKGIALDRIKRHLAGRGARQAFLSFGESSIAVIGEYPGGGGWPVGVEHLYQPGRSLQRVELCDAALSTSGQRAGQAHIADPRTGRLIEGCATMSVACAGAADAEVLSTALLATAPAQRAAIMRHYPGARAVGFTYRQGSDGWSAHQDWHYEQ